MNYTYKSQFNECCFLTATACGSVASFDLGESRWDIIIGLTVFNGRLDRTVQKALPSRIIDDWIIPQEFSGALTP